MNNKTKQQKRDEHYRMKTEKKTRKMTIKVAPAEIPPKVNWVQRAGRSKVKQYLSPKPLRR